jgi:hypothetical protein
MIVPTNPYKFNVIQNQLKVLHIDGRAHMDLLEKFEINKSRPNV